MFTDAIRHPDETFVIEGREDNTVALVGSDDYQCAVIQLELVEGVLEESAWVEEAIVVSNRMYTLQLTGTLEASRMLYAVSLGSSCFGHSGGFRYDGSHQAV